MKKIKKIGWAVGAAVLMAGVAQANNQDWSNAGAGDNVWSNTAKWSLGVLPGTDQNDNARIFAGDTVTVDSAVNPSNTVGVLVRNSTEDVALTIGADMDNISKIDLNISSTSAGRSSQINHNSGTVTVGGNVKVGGDVDSTGKYRQTGGTLDAGAIIVQTGGTYQTVGNNKTKTVTTDSMTIQDGGIADFGGQQLTVNATALNVGVTGAGTVNQTGAGSAVTSAGLNVGAGGAYNLNNGTLTSTAATTLNGTVAVNGGTLTLDTVSNNDITVNGSGLLELTSGTWNDTAAAAGDLTTLHADVAISGGTVALTGQNRFSGEVKVIGDAATIGIARINDGQQAAFVFEFDADGVSTITSSDYVQLDGSSITVDVGTYAGGNGDFTLFDASASPGTSAFVAYSTTLDVSSWQTAFPGTYISQDVGDNNQVILHVIPEPATLGMVAAFGGCLLFVRRIILL